jgi:hypothetical protein
MNLGVMQQMHLQQQLGLQQQVIANQARGAEADRLANLPPGEEGDAQMIRSAGGFGKLTKGHQQRIARSILGKHNNFLTDAADDLAKYGMSEEDLVHALNGVLQAANPGLFDFVNGRSVKEQEKRRKHGA